MPASLRRPPPSRPCCSCDPRLPRRARARGRRPDAGDGAGGERPPTPADRADTDPYRRVAGFAPAARPTRRRAARCPARARRRRPAGRTSTRRPRTRREPRRRALPLHGLRPRGCGSSRRRSRGRRELARAAEVRAALEDADRRLTRFDPDSELSRLNADPRAIVPGLPAGGAARAPRLWAGSGERRAGGRDADRRDRGRRLRGLATGLEPRRRRDALAAAPPRRPARPRAGPGFADGSTCFPGRVVRPPGVRLDSGGLGKGLAADVAAELVPAGVRYAISAAATSRSAAATGRSR